MFSNKFNISALCIAALMGAACLKVTAGPSETAKNIPSAPVKPAASVAHQTAKMLVAHDYDVLTVVLRHFASENSKRWHQAKPNVLLDIKSAGRLRYPEGIVFSDREYKHFWTPPLELRLSLRARNVREVSFAEMKNRDEKILVDKLSKYERANGIGYDFSEKIARSKTKRRDLQIENYASMYLPGYTQDGKTALVYFWFGPEPHGAVANYLLTRKTGRWTVKRYSRFYFA